MLVGLPCPVAVTVAGLVGVEGMNMWLGQTLQLSSIFYLSPVLLTLLSIFSVLLPARVTASTYDVAVDRSHSFPRANIREVNTIPVFCKTAALLLARGRF